MRKKKFKPVKTRYVPPSQPPVERPMSSLTLPIQFAIQTATGREFKKLLANGCNRTCEYDEAEGGIVNHCAACQKRITELAYAIFIIGIPRKI